MAYTTLAKIYLVNDCKRGWEVLLKYLGKSDMDDDPIPMRKLVDAVGIMGAIKMLSTVDGMEHEKTEFRSFLCHKHTQDEITIEFLRVFGD